MKLVISFDELYTQELSHDIIDTSDYWKLTENFIMAQFPEWDIEKAIIKNTFQIDIENKEVSIELRPL